MENFMVAKNIIFSKKYITKSNKHKKNSVFKCNLEDLSQENSFHYQTEVFAEVFGQNECIRQ